jgi:cell pole-organizing protein PopZ
MEEILASIRRIIADDDTTKAPTKAAELPPPPALRPTEPPVPPPVAAASLPTASPAAEPSDINAMLSTLNTVPPSAAAETPLASDVFELTESMATTPQSANGGFRRIDGQSDVFFEERSGEKESTPRFGADQSR